MTTTSIITDRLDQFAADLLAMDNQIEALLVDEYANLSDRDSFDLSCVEELLFRAKVNIEAVSRRIERRAKA